MARTPSASPARAPCCGASWAAGQRASRDGARQTLCERTTRTGSPFWQETSSALFILSKVWSKDCTCGAAGPWSARALDAGWESQAGARVCPASRSPQAGGARWTRACCRSGRARRCRCTETTPPRPCRPHTCAAGGDQLPAPLWPQLRARGSRGRAQRRGRPHPPERTTDWAPWVDWPAMPATWGKCAPHWRQSRRSFQNSPTRIPCVQLQAAGLAGPPCALTHARHTCHSWRQGGPQQAALNRQQAGGSRTPRRAGRALQGSAQSGRWAR